MVGPPFMVPPDRFLSPVSDGRGSYERGSRSALVYRSTGTSSRHLLGHFFQFKCKSTSGTWTYLYLYCHNDGPLLHINIYGGWNEPLGSSTWYLDIKQNTILCPKWCLLLAAAERRPAYRSAAAAKMGSALHRRRPSRLNSTPPPTLTWSATLHTCLAHEGLDRQTDERTSLKALYTFRQGE